MDDLELLRLDAAAAWTIGPAGRIEGARGHPPGPWPTSGSRSGRPGPRLCFAGCRAGNLVHLGAALDAETARRLRSMTDAEPPWFDADVRPTSLDRMIELLAPARLTGPEVVFRLPAGSSFEHPARIVRCDRSDGAALIARLAREGLPHALIEAGFVALDDFWWPWCVAMQAGEIAAMAFATRLAAASAEIGVFTFPGFRGRGLGAAVTAAWSSLDALQGRALIYSTRADNRASRQVAARLGLRAVGARLWID
jgi:RimJ/RimL family protein N-acetyltransferase